MIVYNGCTQNIHQRPHCLYITLPWANNALFHMLLSLVTLHQAPKDTDTLMVTILASVMRSLQTSTCVLIDTDEEEDKGCAVPHRHGFPSAQANDDQDNSFEQAKQNLLRSFIQHNGNKYDLRTET